MIPLLNNSTESHFYCFTKWVKKISNRDMILLHKRRCKKITQWIHNFIGKIHSKIMFLPYNFLHPPFMQSKHNFIVYFANESCFHQKDIFEKKIFKAHMDSANSCYQVRRLRILSWFISYSIVEVLKLFLVHLFTSLIIMIFEFGVLNLMTFIMRKQHIGFVW